MLNALCAICIAAAPSVSAASDGQESTPSGRDNPPALRLTIGDAAPAIDVEHWCRGSAPGAWKKNHVYVLEFWATWCGPCRGSMPHLSELQARYRERDVTFIGVSNENVAVVDAFLKQPEWLENARYTLGTDPDGSTHASFMNAALQTRFPTAFIIGPETTVVWIGHPTVLDEPLENVVNGTWDAEAFRDRFEQNLRAEQAMRARSGPIREAARAGDWVTVMRHYDELIAIAPDNPHFQIEKFDVLLARLNRPEEAYALGRRIIEEHGDSRMVLNALAWFVVDDPGVVTRDLGFALTAAEKANALSDGKDPAVLDTLARVRFEMGDVDEAIEIQRRAVELAPEGPMGDSIREALSRYQERLEG